MKKYFKMATIGYLVLLGMTLGAGLYAGAVVAPVIFHSANWLGDGNLSHYQEGVIMTQNFIRLSYLVDFAMIMIFLYEGYKYKMFERDSIVTLAAIMSVMSGLFFAHYYLPQIVSLQALGESATKGADFSSLHSASEIDFKIFTAALLVLIVRNMQKACK